GWLGQGRSMLREGSGGGAGATGALARIARRQRSQPPVGRAGSARRSARLARAGLRLVHRGVGYRRSEGGQDAARRTYRASNRRPARESGIADQTKAGRMRWPKSSTLSSLAAAPPER